MDTSLVHIVVITVLCFVLIAFRCGYRLLSKCKIHTSCHRTWHSDDAYMAVAIVPLIGRAVCLGDYAALEAKRGRTEMDVVVAMKLLLPGRLCYALFLWFLKLCILDFYVRIGESSTYLIRASRVLWWTIILTFIGVVFATLLECHPLSLFWNQATTSLCQKGLANLLTMAITNLCTDIALILLPIPIIWRMRLSRGKRIQLSLIFGVGIFVVAVTIVRIPLIIDDGVAQSVRSLWASIEIATACFVSNVAFFYALIKDWSHGHEQSNARRKLSLAATSLSHNSSSHELKSVEHAKQIENARYSAETETSIDYRLHHFDVP